VSGVDISALTRSWTHAHEEDSDDLMVFRPSEHDFPPARGRDSFELAPGGELRRRGPGPDDRPVESGGTWSLECELILRTQGRADQHFEIESVDEDRLVVRRKD
jgi:hypothetical protein